MEYSQLELFLLRSADDNAVRLYNIYRLMERLVKAQKKTSLDTYFALIAGFTSIINLVTFYTDPKSLSIVIILSVVFLAIIAFFWWQSRRGEKGEILETISLYGLRLDQMRRYRRQLDMISKFDKPDESIKAVRSETNRKLQSILKVLNNMNCLMEEMDFGLLGENKQQVVSEIQDNEKYLKELERAHLM